MASLVLIPSLLLAQEGDPTEGLKPLEEEVEVWKDSQDIEYVVPDIINTIMGVLGIIAVVIILIGGFMWMTAAGNEERVGKAKKVLTSGLIGLLIVLAAYGIASFVLRSIQSAVQGN